MNQNFKVVLLHDQEEPHAALGPVLDKLGITYTRVRTCAEATQLLTRDRSPHLLFCDTILPDGNWNDVLQLSDRAPVAVNVIVVARSVNIRFYVEVIERGAFDFITPPFVSSDLSHVVRCAAANIADRQFAQARPA